MLRGDSCVPGELWSWSVYVDGNRHRRGPGSTRKDQLKWYATLPEGEHRIVIRKADPTSEDRKESNTLHFIVKAQPELIVEVAFRDGEIILELAE